MCSKEVGLCAQSMWTTLESTNNVSGKTYMISQWKRESSFSYIINKWLIIHMNCKNKEIMGKGGIWICYSSCSKLNVLHSTRSGCRARIVHSKPYLSYFNYQWASSFHFSLQKSKLWQLFESYLFHVLK